MLHSSHVLFSNFRSLSSNGCASVCKRRHMSARFSSVSIQLRAPAGWKSSFGSHRSCWVFRASRSLAGWVMGAKKRMMRSRSSARRSKREFGRFEPRCVLSDAIFGYIRYLLTKVKVAEYLVGESERKSGKCPRLEDIISSVTHTRRPNETSRGLLSSHCNQLTIPAASHPLPLPSTDPRWHPTPPLHPTDRLRLHCSAMVLHCSYVAFSSPVSQSRNGRTNESKRPYVRLRLCRS